MYLWENILDSKDSMKTESVGTLKIETLNNAPPRELLLYRDHTQETSEARNDVRETDTLCTPQLREWNLIRGERETGSSHSSGRKENNPSGQNPFSGQNIKIIYRGKSLSTGSK
jgi:hypothetical protein